MGSEFELLSLIGRIYDAATQPELWPALLTEAAAMLRCQSGLIAYQDLAGRDLSFVQPVGSDPDCWNSYRDYYFSVSPYGAMLNATKGPCYATEELMADADLMRTEFYNDWLRPQDFHYSAGAILLRSSGGAAQVDFQRSKKRGPFPTESRRIIGLLAPHFQRAFRLGQTFGTLRSQNVAVLDTLGRMDAGVILLDGRGWPAYLNPAAEALLRMGVGISAASHGIRACDSDTDAQLQRLIAHALATAHGKGKSAGGSVWVHQAGNDLPSIVTVTPLGTGRSASPLESVGICAAVFLSRRPVSQDQDAVFRMMFGLTAAEARVAVALLEGVNAEEIADRLHVSRETVRTQIKAIYGKAGVKRQAQFIALALRPYPQ